MGRNQAGSRRGGAETNGVLDRRARVVVTGLLAAFALALSPGSGDGQDAAAPSLVLEDGTGGYATGQYRNLFVEAGHTPQEVADKIAHAYDQLFHGDPETQLLFFPSGENENGPLAYIPDIQHEDVRSEGMSYGMMITVQLDKKAEFDALWNWSMTHMYQKDPEHPSYGFFSWQMAYDGTVMDELPAPDGEEYFVMALLLRREPVGQWRGDLRLRGLGEPDPRCHGPPRMRGSGS